MTLSPGVAEVAQPTQNTACTSDHRHACMKRPERSFLAYHLSDFRQDNYYYYYYFT